MVSFIVTVVQVYEPSVCVLGVGRPECCEDRPHYVGGDEPCQLSAWHHPGRLLHRGWKVSVGLYG